MTYFRSETMVYCETLIPRESAWGIMNRLGQLDMVHIIDLPQSYESQFARNLKRCDQTLTRIQHIKEFLSEFDGRRLKRCRSFSGMFSDFDQAIQDKKVNGAAFMNEIQEQVIRTVNFLNQQKYEFDRIKQRRDDLIQNATLSLSMRNVVRVKELLEESVWYSDSQDSRRRSSQLHHKMGLISRKDQLMLQKMVFRVSRGNAWIQTFQIKVSQVAEVFDDPEDFKFIQDKIIFLIMYQTGEHMIVQNKVSKLLNSFDCYIQPQADRGHPANLVQSLKSRENQVSGLYRITKDNIKHYVDFLYDSKRPSENSYLSFLEMYAIKEKTIYQALTQCTSINNFLSFKCFIPKSKLSQLERLKEAQAGVPPFMVNIKDANKVPPSRFLECEMMQIPQEIVNTYGVPTYMQFNPAPLYIVTFGLFIGVMFGDVGHMFMSAIVLLLVRPNRWWWTVVFWMGFCGVIYNQFFGVNLGLFQSCYVISKNVARRRSQHCVYPFGIDPVWKVSSNQMSFTNSFKMKLSVIIGVTHMSVGIVIKGINCIRRKSYVDLLTVAIPQFLFLSSTFLYMDALIVIKWLTKYKVESNAPSIINTLIGMFISNKHKLEFFQAQPLLQQGLMVLALVLIPFLLVAKPLVLWLTGKGSHQVAVATHSDDRLGEPNIEEEIAKEMKQDSEARELESLVIQADTEQDSHDFKQILIHQLIETIEFVLGAVSNTASYLRLWALSLAHGQLSEVFFNLLIQNSLVEGYSATFKIGVMFAFFILITFGVLVCMDVMECFLHSLRLHWVQFQNKFFSGTGYIFDPYSFRKQIKNQQQK